MKVISTYDPQTGKIDSVISGDEAAVQTTIETLEEPWVEGDWFEKGKYVLNGEVVDQPVNPTTLSWLTLNNVPVPATVWIDSSEYQTNESTVELEFSFPGKHKVKVVAFPYLDAEFEIENPA